MWTLVAEASHFTRRNQMKHHNIPYKDGVAGSSPVPPTYAQKPPIATVNSILRMWTEVAPC